MRTALELIHHHWHSVKDLHILWCTVKTHGVLCGIREGAPLKSPDGSAHGTASLWAIVWIAKHHLHIVQAWVTMTFWS